jgi:hypothetical protein
MMSVLTKNNYLNPFIVTKKKKFKKMKKNIVQNENNHGNPGVRLLNLITLGVGDIYLK